MKEKKIEKSLGRVLFSILILGSSLVFADSQDIMADSNSNNEGVVQDAINQNVDSVETSAINQLIITPCTTTVNWHNLGNPTCSSSDEGVTMDVIDQNIDQTIDQREFRLFSTFKNSNSSLSLSSSSSSSPSTSAASHSRHHR